MDYSRQRLQAAVLGAGQCFRKMLPGFRRYFEVFLCFDPEAKAVALSEFTAAEKGAVVESIEAFWERAKHADAIFILSPNRFHAEQVVWAADLRIPVFVEKPHALYERELADISAALDTNPRVYFSDFYPDVRGSALLQACNRRPYDTRWIVPHLDGTTANDNLLESIGQVQLVEARLLEGKGDARSFASRPWLADPRSGGVLWDLAYHHLTMFFSLFHVSIFVKQVQLAAHTEETDGSNLITWTGEDRGVETYAKVSFLSGANWPFELEVAKYWTHDCREFVVTGSAGNLRMVFGEHDREPTTLYEVSNNARREVHLNTPYWDLVAEAFYRHIRTDGEWPHGWSESNSAVRMILAVKEAAGIRRPD
jgi:predicted dehydrogenase